MQRARSNTIRSKSSSLVYPLQAGFCFPLSCTSANVDCGAEETIKTLTHRLAARASNYQAFSIQ